MNACPHCDVSLSSGSPRDLCGSCGGSLGAPPRRARTTSAAPPAPERVLYEGRPAIIASGAEAILAIVTAGLALVVLFARSLSRRYRVTTSRVEVTSSLFGVRRTRSMDLQQIDACEPREPLGASYFGAGDLVLAPKGGGPRLRLAGLRTDVRRLADDLRIALAARVPA